MKLKSKFVLALTFCAFIALSAQAAAAPADLLSLGRVDDAVRALNIRVQSNPADAEAYHQLSRAYYHLKKWDEAVSYGEKAVQLNPNNSGYHMWLGRAYGEKADSSSFITAASLAKKIKLQFEKAVELDGRNIDARSDLAEFYIEAPAFMGGGLDKASEQARQMAQFDVAQAHWVSARIAEKKKDSGAAENEYKAAIQVSQDADYWLNLASFYQRQNRLSEMEDTVNRAVAAPMKKSNSLYDAATLLNKSGRNLAGAAGYVQKYLDSGSINEEAPSFEAHYTLGVIYEKLGNRDAALREYRASLALAGDYKPAKDALKRIGG
jgi:tetratricopeptide (TPR) repeat protein